MSTFGSKKQQDWDNIFSRCDFDFAADLLVHAFAGGIVDNDLAELLSAYTNNPCREMAIDLIEFDEREFLKFFADNKIIMAQMMMEKNIDREELTHELRKPKNLLMQEPEFQAYCDAYLEDDHEKVKRILKKNEELLIAKGYSKETISSAWIEHMSENYSEDIEEFLTEPLEKGDQASKRDAVAPSPELTKEEALDIARITAFRLARHQGRTNAASQRSYTMDPLMYITTVMVHLLTHIKENEAPKKIQTRQDAIELSLDLIEGLVLTYYVEKFGESCIPTPKEICHLTKIELERTLGLIKNKETAKRYADYDPSEARAAHGMYVPFHIALTLGEVGLLKDPPGPTDARCKIIADIVKRPQDH